MICCGFYGPNLSTPCDAFHWYFIDEITQTQLTWVILPNQSNPYLCVEHIAWAIVCMSTDKLVIFLLYNNLFIYQVLCTLIYRRRSLHSFLFENISWIRVFIVVLLYFGLRYDSRMWPQRNVRYFANNVFKYNFVDGNLIDISLKCVHKGRTDNIQEIFNIIPFIRYLLSHGI